MPTRPLLGASCIALALAAPAGLAQKKYDPGVSDTEIKIGQTMPYSGPASSWATIGRVEAAYFRKINEEGGVNGRKIVFLSLDDGYSPPKTVEATRRLVEQDEVLLLFGSVGTATNSAVHGYLNAKKVPQLFVGSGATKWNDPQNFPWTMGFTPSYQAEARILARHIMQTRPDAKVGVLYQNDDFGKDYLKGLKDGLAPPATIVASVSYEPTDPTVDSQIVALQAAGADVFVNVTLPKFAAMAIRRAYDIGWRPTHYLTYASTSIATVLVPAGVEKSIGVMSAGIFKDVTDPQWASDPAIVEWTAFMKKYYPEGSLLDGFNTGGYAMAKTLVHVLKRCGDDLTRENVMRQAASLNNFDTGMMRPGITLSTTATDYAPVEAMQLSRFDGAHWVRFGEVIDVRGTARP